MKPVGLMICLLLSAACGGIAAAAVTGGEFPPRTVGDLIALCSAGKDDPNMTAALNYCRGYTEAAVVVEMAHEHQARARKLFCLPSPRPNRKEALAAFAAWAKAEPARLDRPAIDGMFLFLAETYPCAKKK